MLADQNLNQGYGRKLGSTTIFIDGSMKDVPDPIDPPESFFDFTKYRRGSRGKMATKNEDMFIVWGQNGLLAWLLIIFYTVVMVGRVGFVSRGTFAKIFTKITRILVGAFFIKFLFITLAEIGLHDIGVPQPFVYKLSYLTSVLTLNVYIIDMLYAYEVIKRGYSEKQALEADFMDQFTYNIYTLGLKEKEKQRGNTFLVRDKLRWFTIFLIICCFQLLNRT
jgi:hypothetical protein